ncbi:hypothetical protein JAAARDRAFT_64179 [Jaapia argillacea MUCL 33604]|uniref:Alpha/beta hydrolase fold-3 domain-containing protein n=1 Tax=Jaapia argillacea MUCL 33604 TaxID=933084 RepID=A0A067QDR6_9AGAM|nr:hypothetical protein JAAARDRAFT_64179 [Jaapia argillacea MUCL 33604]
MPVTTLSAAVHITPVVFKTFYRHSKRKGRKFKDGVEEEVATDDILFDESFHIVKAFIQLGTRNTVESLQKFTNTHVPSPPWAAVAPVSVPLASCNEAADVLIRWFGDEELKTVVGGSRWWQVRGLDGIDAEWITEKDYLSEEYRKPDIGRKLSEAEKTLLKMENLETVMFYVHGGGYFWGSINTHRYQIIRYARKMKGRAFAVNYRKAPQYPWPCPLHDVVAAYLYLIHPPKEALHKPVDPAKIVFAGDSAGAAICLSTLTLLRDMDLPLPAGAVLISPWVDLTHSFPSVMSNTPTDIIPPHGFLAKPSTLWPLDPLPPPGGRVTTTTTNPPPKPGHADILKPKDPEAEMMEREKGVEKDVQPQAVMLDGGDNHVDGFPASGHDAGNGAAYDDNFSGAQEKTQPDGTPCGSSRSQSPGIQKVEGDTSEPPDQDDRSGHSYDTEFWEPKPPKVLMQDSADRPLELRSQIQLYATNEQLTHPLVSPVLQGSLGNLCPLYILAGDGEVLRDEVIYTAHRAAHPAEFPTRKGVLKEGRRQQENAEKYRTPTKVHLQVFDGMCHVLTVFTFTDAAKYAYRSIAQFAKHVTEHSEEHLARNPFPELHRPLTSLSLEEEEMYDSGRRRRRSNGKPAQSENAPMRRPTVDSPREVGLYQENQDMANAEVREHLTDKLRGSAAVSENSTSSNQHQERDVPNILMIRERIDIYGKARPMEPKEEMDVLKIRPNEVGIIKEAPCRRWAEGQAEWDQQFARAARKAIRKKLQNEAIATRLLVNARDQGLRVVGDGSITRVPSRNSNASAISPSDGKIQGDRRWGPLDLEGESPPPSAICKRRDTVEALALLRKSIYHTAPATHKMVPKLKAADAVRAAFDPNDDPVRAPRQSVSEQQVKSHLLPIHGLSMWSAIVSYFMRKSSKKAADGTRRVLSTAKGHDNSPSSSS